MTKHLADRRTPSSDGRLRHFLAVERQMGEDGSHPSSRQLAQRKAIKNDGRRMQEFLRIERGRTA